MTLDAEVENSLLALQRDGPQCYKLVTIVNCYMEYCLVCIVY